MKMTLNGNLLHFFCLQTIIVNKISNHQPVLLFILKGIWHNWPNCGSKTAAKHQYHYIIVGQRIVLSISKCIQNAEMNVMLVAAA